MKKLAIATSKIKLPASDQALADALTGQGFDIRPVIWSDTQQDWRQFDAVIVRSCWDYHLRLQEFLNWIALLEQNGIVVWNPPDLIRWNASKVYLAELASSGIAIPDTIFVEPGVTLDLADVCATRGWQSAVVKPITSASAYGTERRASGVVYEGSMVQEYIAAIETEGEWSLVYFDGRFSHAVIKKPCANDFRVQTDFGGTVRVAQPSQELLVFSETVLHRLPGPALYARVDLVAEDASILLMELEVIEPELFLDLAPGSSIRFASAISDLK